MFNYLFYLLNLNISITSKDSSSNKNFMIVKQDIDARRKRREKGKCSVEWSRYISTYLRLHTVLCRSSIGVVQGGELYRHDSPHRSGSGGEGHQAGREEHQEGVSRTFV